LTTAVAILSLVLLRPEGVRAHFVAPGTSRLDADIQTSGSPQYGLPVSPYKDAILATLEGMDGQANGADAEWQDFALKLSVQLRRHRLEIGLSQEEVAHRAGLSRFIYRQYESGESRRGTAANPALRSVLAIAQVLEVSIEELLPRPLPDLRSR
jgi:DNA-binding XRE family transcriptional regulator